MFHNTKRKFVVVESCFEVIFCHGHVFTCSSGCFCACGFVDDVSCETFSIKRSKVLVLQLPLSVVGYFTFIQYLPVVVFDCVGHVSCAAVAYFKVVFSEDLEQFV